MCSSIEESKSSKAKWFPYMKGGAPRLGGEIRTIVSTGIMMADEMKALAIIRNKGGHWSRYLQNLQFLFQKGATWSDISSGKFAVRLSPGGFIHDVKGMGCYTDEKYIFPLIGVLNSSVCRHILSAINPTISFQAGDVRKLPVPLSFVGQIDLMVENAIALSKNQTEESEITYDFIHPPISVCPRG